MAHTCVRFPLCAPQMLVYAVKADPMKQPHTAIMTLSVKPKPKSNGPSRPTARLFAVMLELNQRTKICKMCQMEPLIRSSGKTLEIPRASRPERFSMRSFHLLSVVGTGTCGVVDLIEVESLPRGMMVLSSTALFSTSIVLWCSPLAWWWWWGFKGSIVAQISQRARSTLRSMHGQTNMGLLVLQATSLDLRDIIRSLHQGTGGMGSRQDKVQCWRRVGAELLDRRKRTSWLALDYLSLPWQRGVGLRGSCPRTKASELNHPFLTASLVVSNTWQRPTEIARLCSSHEQCPSLGILGTGLVHTIARLRCSYTCSTMSTLRA